MKNAQTKDRLEILLEKVKNREISVEEAYKQISKWERDMTITNIFNQIIRIYRSTTKTYDKISEVNKKLYTYKINNLIKPYITLNNINYKVGDIIKACFVKSESCFGNDYLPAKIVSIRKNGRVEIEWLHCFAHSHIHPSCIISPNEIAILV